MPGNGSPVRAVYRLPPLVGGERCPTCRRSCCPTLRDPDWAARWPCKSVTWCQCNLPPMRVRLRWWLRDVVAAIRSFPGPRWE